jgi:FMN phosphatase YigB (HAD superfamily)
MRKAARDTVVFDLGGVLIDWDPRYLYRKLFGANEAAMEHFLATVCPVDQNAAEVEHDGATAHLCHRRFSFPESGRKIAICASTSQSSAPASKLIR